MSCVRELVGFEILTVVVMKGTIFWDMTQCSSVSTDVSEGHIVSNFRVFCSAYFFGPEDGGDMSLRNVG
jgi:hypothetical protein